MKIFTTAREDYLKAIYVLQRKIGAVHSVDIARYLGVTKPSVSRAVSVLSKGGFIVVDCNFVIHLTVEGHKIAEKTYERHRFFTDKLVSMGVDTATAEADACKLEHAISDKSFAVLKAKLSV